MIRRVLSKLGDVALSAVPLSLAVLGAILGLAGTGGGALICLLLVLATGTFIVVLWVNVERWAMMALTVVLSLVGLVFLTVVAPALAGA